MTRELQQDVAIVMNKRKRMRKTVDERQDQHSVYSMRQQAMEREEFEYKSIFCEHCQRPSSFAETREDDLVCKRCGIVQALRHRVFTADFAKRPSGSERERAENCTQSFLTKYRYSPLRHFEKLLSLLCGLTSDTIPPLVWRTLEDDCARYGWVRRETALTAENLDELLANYPLWTTLYRKYVPVMLPHLQTVCNGDDAGGKPVPPLTEEQRDVILGDYKRILSVKDLDGIRPERRHNSFNLVTLLRFLMLRRGWQPPAFLAPIRDRERLFRLEEWFAKCCTALHWA